MVFEDKTKDINLLHSQKYRTVGRIDLQREVENEETSRFKIEIYLHSSEGKYAVLSASGCSDINIGRIENQLLAFVEVFDWRDRQLEDAKYRIVETEHELFEFSCSDFSVVLSV